MTLPPKILTYLIDENARMMLAKKHRGEIRIYPAVKQEGKRL